MMIESGVFHVKQEVLGRIAGFFAKGVAPGFYSGIIRNLFAAQGAANNAERWQSGRMYLTRNQAYGFPYRGFESLPLRQKLKRIKALRK